MQKQTEHFEGVFVCMQRHGIRNKKISGNFLKRSGLVRFVDLQQHNSSITIVTDTLKATHVFLFLRADSKTCCLLGGISSRNDFYEGGEQSVANRY